MNFTHQSFATKVYFGKNQLQKINDVVTELGGKRLFVISSSRTKYIVDELIRSSGEKNVFHYSNIVQHVPKETVDEASALAKEEQSNLIVAIGGGSAIGLAKGLALSTHLPILAVPSTYAGSEMTHVYGISSGGVKTVGRNLAVLPRSVIYDPSLTERMPLFLAATSSMNAMAHLIEALYAHDTNPITYQNSLMGIKFLKTGMEQLISEKTLVNANENLQFGAYLGGKSLCEVSMSLHHKAAHVLGGSFGMDHSKLHTVLLPYVLEFQLQALPKSIVGDLQSSLEHEYPPNKLRMLAEQMGADISLKAIGFDRNRLEEAWSVIGAMKFPNPVDITIDGMKNLLRMAYEGRLK